MAKQSWIDAAQVVVQPGGGLVGRWPGVVLVFGASSNIQDTIDLLLAGNDPCPSPEVLRDRVEIMDSSRPIAVVLEQADADRLWVYAAGVSCFAMDGEQLADGGVVVDAAPLMIGVSTTPDAEMLHQALGLVVGLVPGGGVAIGLGSSNPIEGGSGSEVPKPATANGPPHLGKVVFDDGSEYSLESSYVIGRDSAVDLPEGFRSIVLTDAEVTISRAHAEIEVRDQSVVLTDLGSTNGTHILDPATNQWSRLVPNVPALLELGARVAVGGRQFVLERAE